MNISIFEFPAWLASGTIPTLLAQTGTTKTLIGWVIVALCVGLGLLVVCRPAARVASLKKKPAVKIKSGGGH
jgi:hypothetical protein